MVPYGMWWLKKTFFPPVSCSVGPGTDLHLQHSTLKYQLKYVLGSMKPLWKEEKKHGNITTSSWQNFEKKLLLFFLVWEREARHLLGEDFCFDDNQTCGEAFDRCSPLIVWFWSMLGKPTPTRKDDFLEKNPNLKIEQSNLNSVIKPQVLLPYTSPVTLLCWRHPDNDEE